jgi:hypothetical protein
MPLYIEAGIQKNNLSDLSRPYFEAGKQKNNLSDLSRPYIEAGKQKNNLSDLSRPYIEDGKQRTRSATIPVTERYERRGRSYMELDHLN